MRRTGVRSMVIGSDEEEGRPEEGSKLRRRRDEMVEDPTDAPATRLVHWTAASSSHSRSTAAAAAPVGGRDEGSTSVGRPMKVVDRCPDTWRSTVPTPREAAKTSDDRRVSNPSRVERRPGLSRHDSSTSRVGQQGLARRQTCHPASGSPMDLTLDDRIPERNPIVPQLEPRRWCSPRRSASEPRSWRPRRRDSLRPAAIESPSTSGSWLDAAPANGTVSRPAWYRGRAQRRGEPPPALAVRPRVDSGSVRPTKDGRACRYPSWYGGCRRRHGDHLSWRAGRQFPAATSAR